MRAVADDGRRADRRSARRGRSGRVARDDRRLDRVPPRDHPRGGARRHRAPPRRHDAPPRRRGARPERDLDADALERRAPAPRSRSERDDDAATALTAAATGGCTTTRCSPPSAPRAAAREAARFARRSVPVAADALARALAAQGRWSDALELDEATVAEHGDTPERRLRRATCALDAGRPEIGEIRSSRSRSPRATTSPALVLTAGRAALVRGDAARGARRASSACSRRLGRRHRCAAGGTRSRGSRATTTSATATRRAPRGRGRHATRPRRAAPRPSCGAVVQLGKVELFAGEPPQRLHEAVELARAAGRARRARVGRGEPRDRARAPR